jgi:hypothetical protein
MLTDLLVVTGMLGGLIVVMTVAFVFSLAVAHLLSFHIYLNYRGLSTYDFILESRRKAAEVLIVNSLIVHFPHWCRPS